MTTELHAAEAARVHLQEISWLRLSRARLLEVRSLRRAGGARSVPTGAGVGAGAEGESR